MPRTVHFLSGMPRSGSTLLVALLRQNPNLHTTIETPTGDLFYNAWKTLSMQSTYGKPISDAEKTSVLRGAIESPYAGIDEKVTVIDNHRAWCQRMSTLNLLYPSARVICCVRSVGWILDSMERLVQRNPLQMPRIFGYDREHSVYSRAESLMGPTGLVRTSLQAVRQAWYSEQAKQLVVVRYESLVESPAEVLGKLYEHLGVPKFKHDFEHLEFDEQNFDNSLGLPGMHKVRAKVSAEKRTTILPPDLFERNDSAFWNQAGQNPREVTVL